ncbi:MAG: asparagine synthase-related protein [Sedimenticolaceae bacterium]
MIQSISEKDWYTSDQLIDEQASVAIGRVDLGITNKAEQPATDSSASTYAFLYGEFYGTSSNLHPEILATDGINSIITGYNKKGKSFIQDLLGDFAIALYDKPRKKVFVINDRYGRRPLYYCVEKGYVGFASEIKAILEIPDFEASVDQEAIAEMLAFGYVLGNRTVLSNVKLLPPASILEYDLQSHTVNLSTPWRLEDNLTPSSTPHSVLLEELAESFLGAVHRHLSIDQTTGISLSGGMDSRTIMAVIDPKKFPITTITTGIRGGYEGYITQRIAEVVGCEHTFFEAGDEIQANDSKLELTNEAINLTDGMRGSSYNSATVFTAQNSSSRGMEILMTGHAGELAKLDDAYSFSLTGRLPMDSDNTAFLDWSYNRMSRATLRGADTSKLFTGKFAELVNNSPKERLKQVIEKLDADLPIAQKASYMFLNELFRKRAMYAMAIQRAYTVQRLPFLDDDFLDRILRAPLKVRWKNSVHLHILQKYRPELLKIPLSQTRLRPDASRLKKLTRGVSYRLARRLGFYKRDVPEDFWQAKGDYEFLSGILLDDRALDRGLVNKQYLGKLLDNHKKGDKRPFHLLHSLAGVELWYRMFIDKSTNQ